MSNLRTKKKIARYTQRCLQDIAIEKLKDPRDRRGRLWPLKSLFGVLLIGLMAGMKSLKEVERLSESLSPSLRKRLKIHRRIADTTLRDLLVLMDPQAIRQLLRKTVRAAHERKALSREEFPFHVVAMDGKAQVLKAWDDEYVQRQRMEQGQSAFGLLRTVTCCLVSTPSKICLDAVPVPAGTNEMGAFKDTFCELVRHYPKLFEMVTYDAGAASEANGQMVRDMGKHYLLRMKQENRLMLKVAKMMMGELEHPLAKTTDVLTNRRTVVRKVFLREVRQIKGDAQVWQHARTFVRLRSETWDDGKLSKEEERYWVSSLPCGQLSPRQWLSLTRHHWAVENCCHGTFDKIMREDDAPIINMDPKGALAVTLLRRLAYNLLSLFRSVTQRSETNRSQPWMSLFWDFMTAAIADEWLLRKAGTG